MNGLLTGLLARWETGLIEEIEKLERRISHMENQANEGMWIAEGDLQRAQYAAQGGIPLCLKIAQQPIFERYTQ